MVLSLLKDNKMKMVDLAPISTSYTKYGFSILPLN